jgi:protein-S-isoprenylcysteine O-methyltransferase Ste14
MLGKPGAGVSWLGLVLLVAGWVIISLSFRENAFAAPVVKHEERFLRRELKGYDAYTDGVPQRLIPFIW